MSEGFHAQSRHEVQFQFETQDALCIRIQGKGCLGETRQKSDHDDRVFDAALDDEGRGGKCYWCRCC